MSRHCRTLCAVSTSFGVQISL